MIVADLLQLRKITEAEKQTLDLTYPLIIANDDTDDIEMWDGNEWVVLSTGWKIKGNVGTNPANNFIGTTDAQPLIFKTNNAERDLYFS